MAKVKTTFFCQKCGTQYSKWQGQCTSCKSWNTIAEELVQKEVKSDWQGPTNSSKRISKPTLIDDIITSSEERLKTKDEEFNRVLGGGVVPGSLTLLGGEPGIGKSTL
jgi:DNA repair protein RadA/Sms